eukprot:494601-Hanusia_phi.AAC.1
MEEEIREDDAVEWRKEQEKKTAEDEEERSRKGEECHGAEETSEELRKGGENKKKVGEIMREGEEKFCPAFEDVH